MNRVTEKRIRNKAMKALSTLMPPFLFLSGVVLLFFGCLAFFVR